MRWNKTDRIYRLRLKIAKLQVKIDWLEKKIRMIQLER